MLAGLQVHPQLAALARLDVRVAHERDHGERRDDPWRRQGRGRKLKQKSS